jgi:hypothetical protein
MNGLVGNGKGMDHDFTVPSSIVFLTSSEYPPSHASVTAASACRPGIGGRKLARSIGPRADCDGRACPQGAIPGVPRRVRPCALRKTRTPGTLKDESRRRWSRSSYQSAKGRRERWRSRCGGAFAEIPDRYRSAGSVAGGATAGQRFEPSVNGQQGNEWARRTR